MKVLKLVALAATLFITACGDDRFPDYSYKMTIYVGDRAFSSVRHVAVTEGFSIQDSSGRRVDYKVTGEAVVLDLPSGVAYALLQPAEDGFGFGNYAAYIAQPALIPELYTRRDGGRTLDPRYDDLSNATDQLADDAAQHQRMVAVKGPRDLPRTVPTHDLSGRTPTETVWPMFVTFGDAKDPRTVRAVSPDSIGVTRITIEITDEPVTAGIEGRFLWWKHYGDKHFDGTSTVSEDLRSADLAAHLSSGSFTTEFNK